VVIALKKGPKGEDWVSGVSIKIKGDNTCCSQNMSGLGDIHVRRSRNSELVMEMVWPERVRGGGANGRSKRWQFSLMRVKQQW